MSALSSARFSLSVSFAVLLSFLASVLFRLFALVVDPLSHPVEVAFERIHVGGPQPPEGSEPLVDIPQRFGPEPIDAPLGLDARFHEAGLSQDAEVLGHRCLGHPELAFELAHRLFRRREEAEDGPPIRLCDDGERRFHIAYIPGREYARQGIL
jgi:hypothetical protein